MYKTELPDETQERWYLDTAIKTPSGTDPLGGVGVYVLRTFVFDNRCKFVQKLDVLELETFSKNVARQ